MLLILPLEPESTEFDSIITIPLGTLNTVIPNFEIKLPKYYVLKEWLIRCALALIANVFSEYRAESGYIFIYI